MESASSSHSNSSAKLKVGGLWSGIIEVDLEQWTVSMLRAELGKRSICDPDAMNVICAGKILKKEIAHKSLREAGFKNSSKILISKVAVDQGKAIQDELQAQVSLDRLKAAVDAMAKRHSDDSLPDDEFIIELENQSGEKMSAFSETDQRAVKMGLMLHAKGRKFLNNGQYKEAGKIFDMGEEAFSQCNPKLLEMVDNVSLLQIDIVWCYFMLRDISCLAMAGIRLKEARKGLQCCYGSNMQRARVLQGGFCPELAIFTRLELLEGVVAYHTGLLEESQKALQAAQCKYKQLQVSDEALSLLVSMGYTEQQSKRALRMAGQDIHRAVEFAIEEKERINKRREEDRRKKQEMREQRSYGETPMGKRIDMTLLDKLVSIGYERVLAAEALRKNENDMQTALDELTDPASNSALQDVVQSRSRKKRKTVRDEDIAEIMSMGFERNKVVEALSNSSTKEQAIDVLLRELILDANTSAASTSEEGMQLESAAGNQNNSAPIEDRDDEMEGMIIDSLTGDPLADYDIEVEEEGKAISEYLTLLASARGG